MLRQRILSALVLIPAALLPAWYGGWFFVILAVVASVLLAWEWTRLTLGRFGPGGVALAAMAAGVAFLAHVMPRAAVMLILLAAVVAPRLQPVQGRSPWWLAAGAFYIGLPTLSLVWLRDAGRENLFWVLFLVWATDIGAYAAGRCIGGPKLWPRVSPKKTWAGLAGGVASAALVGWGMAAALSGQGPGVVVLPLASGILAVAAQAGDFAESWVKRHFGVKDSSNIIPGHGGVLDRLDGLLVAAPLVATLCLILGGGLSQW